MCGPDGPGKNPNQASVVRGTRAKGMRNMDHFLVDKEATARAQAKLGPAGPGTAARMINARVYQKDEYGRNKLKNGYMYSNADGVDTGKDRGKGGIEIWKKGRNGERPGDPEGGRMAENPIQARANVGSSSSGSSDRRRSGRRSTVLTSSKGLAGPATAQSKTLLGQ